MLKLKYRKVRDPQFMRAMAKLSHSPSFKDPKAAYNIARIIAKLEQETKLAQDLFIKLLKQYSMLDEKGEFLPSEEGPGTYKILADKMDEWKVKLEEFEDVEFEINRRLIKISDVESASLTPAEMHALEPILDHDDADMVETPAPAELATGPAIKAATVTQLPKAVQQPSAKH